MVWVVGWSIINESKFNFAMRDVIGLLVVGWFVIK